MRLSNYLVFARVLALTSSLLGCANATEITLAVRNVTVIDATGAAPRPGMTVLIEADHIAAIGPEKKLHIPRGVQVVDGQGDFLIPGLRDMHVHLGDYDSGRKTLQRMLSQGITGARDMASPLADILRLRADSRSSGPHLVVAGPIFQGPLPFDPPPMIRMVATPDEARLAVRDLKTAGVDFIKLGDTVGWPEYYAIAEESKQAGLPFVGHLPIYVSAAEAVSAGQRSIEHFGSARFHGVLIGCSSEEEQLARIVRESVAAARAGGPSPDIETFSAQFINHLLQTYDPQKAAALFASFAQEGIYQTLTLVALQDVWKGKRSELTPESLQAGEKLWARYSEVVRAMRVAHVSFLAGTDLPVGDGVAPLHDELVLLVQAGLTEMEALQAATRTPAAFLGTLDTEGTVEVGKAADLVLLAANPLDTISNTRKVVHVIYAGKVVQLP